MTQVIRKRATISNAVRSEIAPYPEKAAIWGVHEVGRDLRARRLRQSATQVCFCMGAFGTQNASPERCRTHLPQDVAQGQSVRKPLELRVDLTAEFLVNPFSEPFARVLGGVSLKEEKEHHLIKGFLHNLLGAVWLGEDAEAKAAVDILQQRVVKRLDAAQAEVQALVVPVKHTITIVPIP